MNNVPLHMFFLNIYIFNKPEQFARDLMLVLDVVVAFTVVGCPTAHTVTCLPTLGPSNRVVYSMENV
jgi:hypothetical protein